VIHDRCGSCHRPGGAGPFPLLTYADVSERAEQVAMVIEDGYMPPWKPTGAHGTFQGDRRLTPAQRTLVMNWVQAGAPAGDPSVASPPPRWPEDWNWGPPDLVVTMDEPFELAAQGSDVYRNFVLSSGGLDRNRPVKAWELDPGVPRAVHHALLSTDALGWARREDARDVALGFGGMELGDVQAPDGFYLVWAPGREPRENPAGLTWLMGPGVDLVLQLHMRPTGKAERVAARIGLWFADAPSPRPAFSLRVGDVDIDIPAGARAHRVEDRFTLPIDVTVVSIFPHAHYLARSFEVRAGDTDLLSIDDWDFAWQDDYVYARPVRLVAGQEISLAVTYDNSADNPSNPHQPPRRVQAGPRSEDEMGNVTLTLTPDRPEELPRLREAVYRRLARRTPGDHRAWFNLGNALKDATPPALAHALAAYAKALELSPSFVAGHVNKAIVHHEAGQESEARRHATRALALQPNQPSAKATLALLDGVDPRALAVTARAALDAGRLSEAEAAFRRVLNLAPDLAPAHTDLAVILARRGALREAAAHFEAALRLRPEDPAARANLQRLRVALGAATSP